MKKFILLVFCFFVVALTTEAASGPDLAICTPDGWTSSIICSLQKNATTSDYTLKVGVPVYVKFAITNKGNEAAGAGDYVVTVDGNVVVESYAPVTLAPGDTLIFPTHKFTFNSPGEYIVVGKVDYDEDLVESNESNNYVFAYHMWVGPDLAIYKPGNWTSRLICSLEPNATTPDYTLKKGVTVYARFAVKNKGNAAAGVNDYVIKVGGAVVVEGFAPVVLYPGEIFVSPNHTFKYNSTGQRTVTCKVDYDEDLIELNESNNSFSDSYEWVENKSDLVPYTPDGWDAPLICSMEQGATTPDYTLEKGVPVYVKFAVKNIGNKKASLDDYVVMVGGEVVLTEIAPTDLDPDETFIYPTRQFTFNSTGVDTVTGMIDYDEDEDEINEDNNTFSATYEWVEPGQDPDPVPDSCTPYEVRAVWLFDEAGGPRVYDHSVNNNYGVLRNSPQRDSVTPFSYACNRSLRFNGTNNYVEIPADESLFLDSNGTVECWVKFDALPDGTHDIIGGGAQYRYCFLLSQDGDDLRVYWTSTNAVVVLNDVFTAGEWYHIAVTNDEGNLTVYINGAERGTGEQGGEPYDEKPIYIGDNPTFARCVDGFIDEVRILNYPRTSEQIWEDFSNSLLPRLTYLPGSDRDLAYYQSEFTPAYLIHTVKSSLNLFDEMDEFGLDGPTTVAFAEEYGITVTSTWNQIDLSDMSEPWLLFWFNGSPSGLGWNDIQFIQKPAVFTKYENPYNVVKTASPEPVPEFDVPWLVVLQRRPESLSPFGASGVKLNFPFQANYVCMMPLYGVKRLSPDVTSTWNNTGSLPDSVKARCRYWSQALRLYPIGLKETFSVDRLNDEITIHDEFEYLTIEDDWGTSAQALAPIAPMLGLIHRYAGEENNILSFDGLVSDLNYMTPYGPLYAVQNERQLTYFLDGMVKYANQVPDVHLDSHSLNTDQVDTLIDDVIDYVDDYIEHCDSFERRQGDWEIWYDRWAEMEAFRWDLQGLNAATIAKLKPYLELEDKWGSVESLLSSVLNEYFNIGNYIGFSDKKRGIDYLMFEKRWDAAKWVDAHGAGGMIYSMYVLADALDGFDSVKMDMVRKIWNTTQDQDWIFFPTRSQGDHVSGMIAGSWGMARMAAKVGDRENYDLGVYSGARFMLNRYASIKAADYAKECGQWCHWMDSLKDYSFSAGRVGNLEPLDWAFNTMGIKFFDTDIPVHFGWEHNFVTFLYEENFDRFYKEKAPVTGPEVWDLIEPSIPGLVDLTDGEYVPTDIVSPHHWTVVSWQLWQDDIEVVLDLLGEQKEGITAYWPMDEGSGNSIYDLTSNSNDGELGWLGWLYKPDWTPESKVGPYALLFNGINDYVKVPADESLVLGSNGTVECWVRFGALPDGTHDIIGGGEQYRYCFLLSQNGDDLWVYWTSTNDVVVLNDVFTTGEWYHIAVTNDEGNLTVYINGTEEGTGEQGGEPYLERPLYIGDNPTFARCVEGIIDEVKIFDRSLTSEEVLDEFNCVKGIEEVFVRAVSQTKAGLRFPKKIEVFTSNDLNGDWQPFGSVSPDPGSNSETALWQEFTVTHEPPVLARYVKIVVKTEDYYWFTDEVGVRDQYGNIVSLGAEVVDTLTSPPPNYRQLHRDWFAVGSMLDELSADSLYKWLQNIKGNNTIKPDLPWRVLHASEGREFKNIDLSELSTEEKFWPGLDKIRNESRAVGIPGAYYRDYLWSSTGSPYAMLSRNYWVTDYETWPLLCWYGFVAPNDPIVPGEDNLQNLLPFGYVSLPYQDAPSMKTYLVRSCNCLGGYAGEGLVASLPMDEGAGDAVYDKCSFGNNASRSDILSEKPVWVNGYSGKALRFDGENDYLKVPADESLVLDSNGTVECWVKFDALPDGTHDIIGGGEQYRYCFLLSQDSTDLRVFWTSTNAVVELYDVFTTETWYHIAVTNNEGNLTVYINETEEGTGYQGEDSYLERPIYIGDNPTFDRCVDGIIDEIKIHDADVY